MAFAHRRLYYTLTVRLMNEGWLLSAVEGTLDRMALTLLTIMPREVDFRPKKVVQKATSYIPFST